MNTPPNTPVFELETVTSEIVLNVVKDLSPSTSCRVDGLTSRLIKSAGIGIFKPLTHVNNLSITTKMFPDSWKTVCITPLHKSGDSSDPGNFRPISILPCLGKFIEKIVHLQLY